MAASALNPQIKLPPGFVLDPPQTQQPAMNLPPGFVLDEQPTVPQEEPQGAGLLPNIASALLNRFNIPNSPEGISEAGSALGSDLLNVAKSIPKTALSLTPLGQAMQASDRAQQGIQYAQGGQLPPEAQHYQEQQAKNEELKKGGVPFYSRPNLGYRLLSPVAENLGVNVSGMEQGADAGNQGKIVGHSLTLPVLMAATAGATKGLGAAGDAIADAIPSKTRAGSAFSQVMSKASDVPVDMSGPGNSALRIQELADRGGSMPMVVRKFLKRVTDPEQGPITYKEARDFQSNVSRLSADEAQRLTPALKAEVSKFAASLKDAVANAADSVGQGENYRGAMKEYRQAARVGDFVEGAKDVGKDALIKGLGYGAGGALGGYLLRNLLYPTKATNK